METIRKLSSVQELLAPYAALPVLHEPDPNMDQRLYVKNDKAEGRKGKKRSVEARLRYLPQSHFTDDPDAPIMVDENPLHHIFVEIILSNNICSGYDNVDRSTHMLPLTALDELFRLHNSICDGKVFDYYMDYICPPEERGYAQLLEEYRNEFFSVRMQHTMFGHGYYERHPTEAALAEYNVLYLFFENKTSADTPTRTPYVFQGIWYPRRLCECYCEELNTYYTELLWDTRQLTRTTVRMEEKDLLRMIENIHRKVGELLEQMFK